MPLDLNDSIRKNGSKYYKRICDGCGDESYARMRSSILETYCKKCSIEKNQFFFTPTNKKILLPYD